MSWFCSLPKSIRAYGDTEWTAATRDRLDGVGGTGHAADMRILLDFTPPKDLRLASLTDMDIRKAALIFTGTVCVALGVLGMFLPLLPTTVFLLMAAYCYSRSSERFHTWLLNNRLCGKYIRNYRSGQGISLRQKITTISILWLSIGFSIWMLSAGFWITVLLLTIAIAVSVHLVWIKTYRPETTSVQETPATEI